MVFPSVILAVDWLFHLTLCLIILVAVLVKERQMMLSKITRQFKYENLANSVNVYFPGKSCLY